MREMKCPGCATEMDLVDIESIEIDKCPQCRGIVLDKGESESIATLGLAKVIEANTPSQAEREEPAHCYECKRDMIALTGAGEVEYDWCDGCERLFFDRGELAAFDSFIDS